MMATNHSTSNRYEMSNALVRLMWKWHLSSHVRNPTRRWCGRGRLIRKHPNRSSVLPSVQTNVRFSAHARKKENGSLPLLLKSINCAVALPSRHGAGQDISCPIGKCLNMGRSTHEERCWAGRIRPVATEMMASGLMTVVSIVPGKVNPGREGGIDEIN